MSAQTLLHFVEVAAVLVSALSGILEARKKKMDLVGVYFLALVTAFGGGTMRDLLLDRRPFYWVENNHYILWIFLLCFIALYFTRTRIITQPMLDIPDALGLGLFSITGAFYALEQNMTYFTASLFGVITGTFGGVLRDIICNEIPAIFSSSNTLYATCAFAGSWVYLLGVYRGAPQLSATLAGIAVTFLLRMLAIRYSLRLPTPLDERK